MTATCSTCRHYRPHPGEPKGECWFNPPVLFHDKGRGRPPVHATEWCGRHEEGAPEPKEKKQPDTPGAAAKAARAEKGKKTMNTMKYLLIAATLCAAASIQAQPTNIEPSTNVDQSVVLHAQLHVEVVTNWTTVGTIWPSSVTPLDSDGIPLGAFDLVYHATGYVQSASIGRRAGDLVATLRHLQRRVPGFRAVVVGRLEPAALAACAAAGAHHLLSVSEPEKFRLLKASRVFLMPSRFESFGNVVAEALCAGTPVVAYRLPVFEQSFGRLVTYATDLTEFEDFARAHALGWLQPPTAGESSRVGARFGWPAAQRRFLEALDAICQPTITEPRRRLPHN